MDMTEHTILTKRPGESELEYHRRLVYGKQLDKTLADYDYSELSEYVYGKPYSADITRRMMYGSCRTLQLLDEEAEHSVTADDILGEIEAKKLELQKERYKMYDQRNALNKLIRERSRQEELNEIILDAVEAGRYPSLEYEYHQPIQSDNDLLVSLCDIHYGADVDNHWCLYNSDVCREMFRKYLDNIVTIGRRHNSENCIVWANGDMINGNIHHSIAVTNKENVIEQIVGVAELIAEFLAALSSHFTKVRFVCVAGNHSRIDPNKDKALKDERLDDLIEWYLTARLQNFENIVFGDYNKIDSTMYVLNVRSKKFAGAHGDYDGGKNGAHDINVMAGGDVYGILTAHKHHNSTDTVQGVKVIMGGSFLGMDDFCVTKRIYGSPEQMVCVCTKDGIECIYDVNLDVGLTT